LAAVCAAIIDQQHGPNEFMINHVNNLLQRDGNQDVHVLADNQIVHANQFGCFGVVFGMLDCNRCLSK
jgi:hypothetical protein